MNNDPLVSVVILCWNRREEVLETIQHVLSSDYEKLQVIVVDNGSEDGSASAVREQYSDVELICLPNNIGVAGYNFGFKKAIGKYLLILDDDSWPAVDAISKMVRVFSSDDSVGVVAFNVRRVGGCLAPDTNVDADRMSELREVGSFNGAGAGVRADLLKEAGYYPGEFFLYWNEQDLSFRLLAKEARIVSASSVLAYHKFSPRNRTSERAAFYYTRNAFWLIWKYYPTRSALIATSRLVVRCFFHACEQRTLVYLKALVNAFTNFNQLRDKRTPLSSRLIDKVNVNFELAFTQYG